MIRLLSSELEAAVTHGQGGRGHRREERRGRAGGRTAGLRVDSPVPVSSDESITSSQWISYKWRVYEIPHVFAAAVGVTDVVLAPVYALVGFGRVVL